MRTLFWTIPLLLAGAPLAASDSYGKLPLSFEPNQGQSAAQVKFLSRGSGYTLLLTDSAAILKLRNKSCGPPSPSRATRPEPCSSAEVAFQLAGANGAPRVSGEDPQEGHSNYFIGNDPAQWHTNIANYGKVEYHDVYPGVNLVYYGNQRQLEYDFVVS